MYIIPALGSWADEMDSLPSARMFIIILLFDTLRMSSQQQPRGMMMIKDAQRTAMAEEMISCPLDVSPEHGFCLPCY